MLSNRCHNRVKRIFLYDPPFEMVELMLDDLGCPSGVFLPVLLPAAVQIFYFNVLITGGLPDTVQ